MEAEAEAPSKFTASKTLVFLFVVFLFVVFIVVMVVVVVVAKVVVVVVVEVIGGLSTSNNRGFRRLRITKD